MARRQHRARRVDRNQKEVVAGLRAIPGIQVDITSDLGGGFPDLVVSGRGRTILVEVKAPGHEDDLTPDEVDWWDGFTGDGLVASTADQVLEHLEYI